MRLIDADMLMEDLGSDIPEDIVKVIENSPTIYPIFSGRQSGKTVMKYYLEMCQILENHGISANKPSENLDWVLNQYQKVLMELTGSMLSKLTYDANFIIPYIVDRLDECEEGNTNDN